MSLESLVPPKFTCEKLKRAGFPQEGGGFYWQEDTLIYVPTTPLMIDRAVKAPTAEELFPLLPSFIRVKNTYHLVVEYWEPSHSYEVQWVKDCITAPLREYSSTNLAEALALAWLEKR